MASLKADKPSCTQGCGQKKEPTKPSDGAPKAPASMPGSKKVTEKPLEPKNKVNGGKPAVKR